MFPKKKINSFQDLYPTVQKTYGIENRKSENFRINIPYVTFLTAMPPLLVTLALMFYYHTSHQTKTDIANYSILFIIIFILVGVFAILFMVRARTVLRRSAINPGFLTAMYLLAFLPTSLVVANIVVQSTMTISGIHYGYVAAISVVIIMFLYALVARVTNR